MYVFFTVEVTWEDQQRGLNGSLSDGGSQSHQSLTDTGWLVCWWIPDTLNCILLFDEALTFSPCESMTSNQTTYADQSCAVILQSQVQTRKAMITWPTSVITIEKFSFKMHHGCLCFMSFYFSYKLSYLVSPSFTTVIVKNIYFKLGMFLKSPMFGSLGCCVLKMTKCKMKKKKSLPLVFIYKMNKCKFVSQN